MEHEEHTGLGGLQHHGNPNASLHHFSERGRRRVVVVPDVVMHGLEVPRHLARLGAERDDRIGVAIVTGSEAAEVVGGRA